MLFLHIPAKYSKQLRSYAKVVDPGDVADKIFANNVWYFLKLHGLTELFQFFIDYPKVVSEKFKPLISADKS